MKSHLAVVLLLLVVKVSAVYGFDKQKNDTQCYRSINKMGFNFTETFEKCNFGDGYACYAFNQVHLDTAVYGCLPINGSGLPQWCTNEPGCRKGQSLNVKKGHLCCCREHLCNSNFFKKNNTARQDDTATSESPVTTSPTTTDTPGTEITERTDSPSTNITSESTDSPSTDTTSESIRKTRYFFDKNYAVRQDKIATSESPATTSPTTTDPPGTDITEPTDGPSTDTTSTVGIVSPTDTTSPQKPKPNGCYSGSFALGYNFDWVGDATTECDFSKGKQACFAFNPVTRPYAVHGCMDVSDSGGLAQWCSSEKKCDPHANLNGQDGKLCCCHDKFCNTFFFDMLYTTKKKTTTATTITTTTKTSPTATTAAATTTSPTTTLTGTDTSTISSETDSPATTSPAINITSSIKSTRKPPCTKGDTISTASTDSTSSQDVTNTADQARQQPTHDHHHHTTNEAAQSAVGRIGTGLSMVAVGTAVALVVVCGKY